MEDVCVSLKLRLSRTTWLLCARSGRTGPAAQSRRSIIVNVVTLFVSLTVTPLGGPFGSGLCVLLHTEFYLCTPASFHFVTWLLGNRQRNSWRISRTQWCQKSSEVSSSFVKVIGASGQEHLECWGMMEMHEVLAETSKITIGLCR